MLSEQRYHLIMEELNKNSIVKIQALCKTLDTTRETVRRDLMALEEEGLLKRIRGGAMKVDKPDNVKEYTPFDERLNAQLPYKATIVDEALNTIHDGQVIALDSGTTDLLLAQRLKGRFSALTVVTNSLAIANAVADVDGLTLILTGGVYRPDEEAFVSGFAELLFPKIHIDTFYLTTCGISVDVGLTYQRMDEISVQNEMLKAADQTIAIADGSKLGVNSLVRMCGINVVSTLITDYSALPEQVRQFEDAGVRVIVAPQRSSVNHE